MKVRSYQVIEAVSGKLFIYELVDGRLNAQIMGVPSMTVGKQVVAALYMAVEVFAHDNGIDVGDTMDKLLEPVKDGSSNQLTFF